MGTPVLAIILISLSLFLTLILLKLRFTLSRSFWLKVWFLTFPILASSIFTIPQIPFFPTALFLLPIYIFLGLWGYVRFYPINLNKNLHKARFARIDELSQNNLLSKIPIPNGLLLGVHKYMQFVNFLPKFLIVRPTKQRREIGNMLIVAPTRGGKGLLAVSQLLTWKHSIIVNDIKGELYYATAGYRKQLGHVFVIDPTGQGNCYDPLAGKKTEDKLASAATNLLFTPDEKDVIFTQRATVMLTKIFQAAAKEGIPAIVYTRELINAGLPGAAKRLYQVDPKLATRFLDTDFAQADFTDKFLKSCWSTLTTKIEPLVRDPVIRTLTKSDFTADDILRGNKPVTIYLKWKEQDLLALSPLVRLMWSSIIDELLTTYDTYQGQGCNPVLMLIDEAGRSAIPSLADHITTVAGRGISLWIAIQSLSQLEAIYGKARAHIIRDNMDTQIYYRPTDLATAKYLEERIGLKSGWSHSYHKRELQETGQGESETGIPLVTAQEILQMKDHEILAFHRRLPPFRLHRIDWRKYAKLIYRRSMPVPQLAFLPAVAEIGRPPGAETFDYRSEYIDPDLLQTRR